MMELSLYTPEQIERAKHRGRAYQCLACHFQNGVRWVDELGKLEDHILRTHIPPERVPFSCRLCKFKCLRQEQLIRHVSHYARHVSMAAGRNIIDHGSLLCSSQNPYHISALDYHKLTPEESLKFFLEKFDQSGRSSSVDTSIAKLLNGTLQGDLCQDTLQAGYIMGSADVQPSGVVRSSTSGQPSVSTFKSVVLTPGVSQPVTASQPTGGLSLYRSQPTLPISVTPVQITSPLDVLTGQVPVTTFSPLIQSLTQPLAATQPLLGQPLSSLFQPQSTLLTNVSMSAAVTPMPLADVSSRLTSSTSIPGLCRSSSSLMPTAPVLDDDHGTYDPSSPVRLTPNQLAEGNSARNSAVIDQYPMEDSENRCLPEQPIPESHLQQADDQTDQANSEVEDILPQLLPKEDMSVASTSSNQQVRKQKLRQDGIDKGQESKRQRLEAKEDGDTIRVSLVAINGLVSSIQSLAGQMARNEKKESELNKALTETNCSLGKVADALHRLKETLEENAKEEKKREERWLERERKREEELRKDREVEQRRETRRREAEKKEREEMRKLLEQALDRKEDRSRDRQAAAKREEKEGKENTKVLKSIVKKVDTERNDSNKRK